MRSSPAAARPAELFDSFGRQITYLRVSVTDRCDLRCVYCMAEHMTFLPKRDLLSLEELDRLCTAFIGLGVRKLRLTGGEPLVRRDLLSFVGSLSRHLQSGALDELTLTTNGLQLETYAKELARYGVKRINVSLDTLDPEKFRAITRWEELPRVLDGIATAQRVGLYSIFRFRSFAPGSRSATRWTISTTAPVDRRDTHAFEKPGAASDSLPP
jgi:GTP 3',8-cyclase